MQPKKFHRTKTKGNPRTDVNKMSQPDIMELFAQTFEKKFSALQPGDSGTEKWEALRDTMYRTALVTFGKRSSKSHDWFQAKSAVMPSSLPPPHPPTPHPPTRPPPSLKPSELPWQSTISARGTYRFSGLPGARLSRLLGAAQTNTGQNSARTSSLPP